jgi:hypothetical protein
MKKTLPLFALALAAGCTSTDYSAQSQSPWAYEGTSSGPNPIASAFTLNADPSKEQPESYRHQRQYSWEVEKQTAKPVAPDAVPEDPSKLRITDANVEFGLYEFVTAEKPAKGEVITVTDDRTSARVRIVAVDKGRVVAELLPNQVALPPLNKGVELRFFKPEQQS